MDEFQILLWLCAVDFRKAFDSIDHSILLHKLGYVGASPTTVKWFTSYLTGRSQSVRIGSSISPSLLMTHGVPQSAILSPLLFCLYIQDLPLVPRICNIESYVDDSKVYLSFQIKNIEQAVLNLEEDLLGVAKWCCENN